LLLRLAGLVSSRDALQLKTAQLEFSDEDIKTILTDIRPKQGEERVELLADASINDLGARAMSQPTRDIFHRVRDYIAAAARELAEREEAELNHQLAYHTTGSDD